MFPAVGREAQNACVVHSDRTYVKGCILIWQLFGSGSSRIGARTSRETWHLFSGISIELSSSGGERAFFKQINTRAHQTHGVSA